MRLNLGAGDWTPAGWTSVDLFDADVLWNLALFPWPFQTATATAILASHILEHFARQDAARFLDECRRILRPGAPLLLAVPDLDRFIDCHLSGDFSPLAGYRWTSLDTLMGGGHNEPRPEQRHRYMWCEGSLRQALTDAGFVWVRRTGHIAGVHQPAYEAISLYMEART